LRIANRGVRNRGGIKKLTKIRQGMRQNVKNKEIEEEEDMS